MVVVPRTTLTRVVVEWMQIAGAFSLNALIVCPVHGHGHHHHYVLLSIYVGITKGALFPPTTCLSTLVTFAPLVVPSRPEVRVCPTTRRAWHQRARILNYGHGSLGAATTTQDGDCPWPSYHIVHPFILLRPFIGRPHSVAVLAAVAT